jgi:hypothetical protein
VVDALLRAGELECALADHGSAENVLAVQVTDAVADQLVSRARDQAIAELVAVLERIDAPAVLVVSAPEGFTYYGLHPLQYSHLSRRVLKGAHAAAIIGIRSIGTVLGAVCAATMRHAGIPAARITVRPGGHPFDRDLEFTEPEREWIADQNRRDATFAVVDEGPGLSGSSFLAVAEALLRAGVQRDRIVLLCSYQPDLDALVGRDARDRWCNFHFEWVDTTAPRSSSMSHGRLCDISAGRWREHFISDQRFWPASWTQNERVKFLAQGGRRLFKFEGHGRFGKAVYQRAEGLARCRLGPAPACAGDGFVEYGVVAGAPMRSPDLDPGVVRELARYCAVRSELFPAPKASTAELKRMMHFNISHELGFEIANHDADLVISRPVVADARMHPHEWLRRADGGLLKVDGASHGDDHFLPGLTDIAWDLAGAITEWQMDHNARATFLSEYERLSGDRASSRLRPWLLAYTAFQLGYANVAAGAMKSSTEERRLRLEHGRYRDALQLLLGTVRPQYAAGTR